MKEIIKFFEKMGKQYKENHLCEVEPYIDKMKKNKYFALQMFLFYWAYERAGASKGYKIAAVKAVEKLRIEHKSNIVSKYKYFYPDPTTVEKRRHNQSKNKRLKKERRSPIAEDAKWDVRNEKNNPCCNETINGFLNDNSSISTIINEIEGIRRLDQTERFERLKGKYTQCVNLNGIRDKIASFFLRDIVELTLSGFYKRNFTVECYLYLMPVDIWVKTTYKCLNKKFHESNNTKEIKEFFIKKSIEFKVSPLLVNMGIWYFCSIIVQDERRLSKLFKGNKIEILENLKGEEKLMGIFGKQKSTLPKK
jgi:hypothetical protein